MRLTDSVGVRNIYPTMDGGSLGIASTSPSEQTSTPTSSQEAAQEASRAGRGNPLLAWAVALIFFFGLVAIAQRLGDAEDFRNIRGSAYNVLFIGLAAVISIPIYKLAVVKLPVPAGAKDYVLSV